MHFQEAGAALLGLRSVFGAGETSTMEAHLPVVCLSQCLRNHMFRVRLLLFLGSFDSLRTVASSLMGLCGFWI
jgi:hypothetical protein